MSYFQQKNLCKITNVANEDNFSDLYRFALQNTFSLPIQKGYIQKEKSISFD